MAAIDAGIVKAHCRQGIPGILIGDDELDLSRIEAVMTDFGVAYDGSPITLSESKARAKRRSCKAAKETVPLQLFADTPVSACGFPTRLANVAASKGITTVEHLVTNLREIGTWTGIGQGTLDKARSILDAGCAEVSTAPAPSVVRTLALSQSTGEYAFGPCGELLKVIFYDADKALRGNGMSDAFICPHSLGFSNPPVPGQTSPDQAAFVATFEAAMGTLGEREYPIRRDAAEVMAHHWCHEARAEGRSLSPMDLVAAFEKLPSLGTACENALVSKLGVLESEAANGSMPSPVKVAPGKLWAEAARNADCRNPRFIYDPASREITVKLPTVDTWLASLNETHAEVLKLRFAGLSIPEIAARRSVSRQRVHQILTAEKKRKPLVAEDRYRGVYKGYAFSLSDFCDVTGEPPSTYRYLDEVYGKCGKAPLRKAIADNSLPEEIRWGIRALVDKEYVYVGDERIRRDRESVLEHLVRKYATDTYIGRVELYRLYLDFARKHNLEEILSGGDLKEGSFTGYVQRRSFVLYAPAGQGRGAVRYYDFEERDFEGLRRYVLNLGYEDVEVSATHIFERPDAADLMAELDIRDGYELYAVLKQVFDGDKRLVFERAPHLSFGNAYRERQVLDLIAEIGPVDADGLASAYRQRYGVREDTFRANFTKLAAPCLKNGVYSMAACPLTGQQRAFIEDKLSEDMVSVDLVRSRFKAAFPDAPAILASPDEVAEFGFTFDGGLLVKKGVDLPSRCAELIASRPLFKMGDPGFDRALFESEAFKAELNKALRSLDVIECGKGEFASTACLAALDEPVTKEELQDYMDQAYRFMEPGRPYTVKALRAKGFAHSLDRLEGELGMDEWLYASLICLGRFTSGVKRTTWKDTVVFGRDVRTLNMPDVAEWAMRGKCGCTTEDLCEAIQDELGFSLSEYEMRGILRRTDLLLKEDIGMVFESEEAFREKLRAAVSSHPGK